MVALGVCAGCASEEPRPDATSSGQEGEPQLDVRWSAPDSEGKKLMLVEGSGFEPNAELEMECWGDYQGWSAFKTLTVSSDETGNFTDDTCYFGYLGGSVDVRVGDLRSSILRY